MNNNRPVNLALTTIKFPITAIVSILHRVTGVLLFAGVGVLLWLLDNSLASEERFVSLQQTLASPLWQLVVWAVLAVLAYHTVAGIRHLLMDVGIGEGLPLGRWTAWAAVVIALVLAVLAGVWLW